MTEEIPSGTGAQPRDTAPDLSPHPPLRDYYPTTDARPRTLQGLFDASASHYDWINHVLSLGTGVRYRRAALLRAGLSRGASVLDVACGTGVIANLASEIAGPDGDVLGVDPSPGMRAIARDKRGVRTKHGFAEDIPVPDGSVDFLVMGYGLRHVADLGIAFREFRRVLRPGGTLLILEITAPDHRIGRGLLRLYLKGLVPAIARLGSRSIPTQTLMRYHWDSIEECVRPATILEALRGAGFQTLPRFVSLGMFSEYTATRPHADEPVTANATNAGLR